MSQRGVPAPPRTGARVVPLRRRGRPLLAEIADPPAQRTDRVAGDREFLPPALEMIEAPPSRPRVILGYAIAGLFATLLIWSVFGRLSVLAVAPGEIQAAGDTRVVEPRQAGQVSAIRVKDGDRVKQGDILVELNPTTAVANRTVIVDKLTDLRAEIARWRVEMTAARGDPVDPAPPIPWDREVPQKVREREQGVLHADLSGLAASLADLEAQRQQKEAARDKFTAGIAAQNSLIAVLSEHVEMHQKLVADAVESRAKLLEALVGLREAQTRLASLQGSLADAIAAIAVIDSEIVKTREDFIAADARQVETADRSIDDLEQQLAKASQTVADMTLAAPIAGTVEATAVTTIGQVVKSGQQLLQVVPDGEPLEIVAYVLNTDIGFVRPGQPATIKVDTFPYTRYGTIAGTVTKVGTDAIPGKEALNQQKNGSLPPTRGTTSDTAAAQPTADLVFPVVIAPAKTSIAVAGRAVPLSSGMSVAIEIETDRQRIISYIISTLVHGYRNLTAAS